MAQNTIVNMLIIITAKDDDGNAIELSVTTSFAIGI